MPVGEAEAADAAVLDIVARTEEDMMANAFLWWDSVCSLVTPDAAWKQTDFGEWKFM